MSDEFLYYFAGSMESTSAAAEPQEQMTNMMDVCLYLPYFFPSSSAQRAPVSGANSSSLSSYLGNKAAVPLLESIKYVLAGVINPTLCVFGLVGNIFSVVVLSRRRMRAAMNVTTMEQSAYIGLLALSVSDSLYCVSALWAAVQSRQQVAFRHDDLVHMYAQLYGPYLQNAFMHTGSWLTVIMAAGRYAAICHPLQASKLR